MLFNTQIPRRLPLKAADRPQADFFKNFNPFSFEDGFFIDGLLFVSRE